MRAMQQVKRTVLVPYTAEQMFALVADIERYPEFVPWITATKILEQQPGEVVGTLGMRHSSGLREELTTRNVLTPPGRMEMQLVSGPFKELVGVWTFVPILANGQERGTSVEFNIRFAFSNPLMSLLLSKSFEKSCNELVDAFVQRARKVYAKQA